MSTEVIQGAPSIVPGLHYEDAEAAIEWLVSAFGFEKKLVVPGEGGTIAHAELTYGNGLIMLGTTREDDRPAGRRQGGANGHGIYVCVPDIDAHHARARAAGANIVRDLFETDYGSRDYSARDLEGNLWHFGTYVPGSDDGGS